MKNEVLDGIIYWIGFRQRATAWYYRDAAMSGLLRRIVDYLI